MLKARHSRRRGIAIELAVSVMLAVTALSVLIVSLSLIQSRNLERTRDRLSERTELDQIGESFCAAAGGGESWSLPEDSAYSARTDGLALTVTREGTVVLTVELWERENGQYVVTKWSYE